MGKMEKKKQIDDLLGIATEEQIREFLKIIMLDDDIAGKFALHVDRPYTPSQGWRARLYELYDIEAGESNFISEFSEVDFSLIENTAKWYSKPTA